MKFQKISSKIKNRFLFLIIIFLCFSSSIYLISYSLKDKISYFYSPTEIQIITTKPNQIVRVGGLLKRQSLKLKEGIWYFDIIDENKNTVGVIFDKTLPNLVEEDKGIIVEGTMQNKIIIAKIVLAKHDENYMPQSAVDKMKSEGIWRGD